MSDDEREFEELRKRLADEGQAQAPADLAGDVMRQVRAEPRRRPRRSLRPALVPLAAALLAAAAIAGLSRLDVGGAGSASGGGSFGAVPNEGKTAPAPSTTHGGAATADKVVIHGVPSRTALQTLGPLPERCPAHPEFYAAAVPWGVYDSLQTRLQNSAAIATPGTPLINVQLRHAPKTQTQIRITCP
jgi:hypothetical protein